MTVQGPADSRSATIPRPTLVTAAAAVMTLAGAFVSLIGSVGLFARGPAAAGLADILHWPFILVPPILLPLGVVDLVAARGLLRGAPWARVGGLIAAALLALFGLFALGADATAGAFLLSVIWIAANGFVLLALSVTGGYFARRA